MKILTVIYDLDKGGTQKAAQIFAEAYKQLGHDSRILSLYGLGSRYEDIKDKLFVWCKITDENLDEIKIWSPDIIHLHSHGPKKEDVEKLLNSLQKTSTKIIEQNVFSRPSPWVKKIDISYQLSNWALWLYYMRGGTKLKAAIVPYPIDCDKFYPRSNIEITNFKKRNNIPEEAFVVGRIGQSFSGKWSEILIDSFNILAKKYSDAHLIIVNPPENILKKVDKSLYKDRIIHIPKIYGDEDLSIAYSSFDLMIHTAEQGESFGYVLPESILCGTPVVTLSTPWGDNSQCEVVSNLIGGYVVNDLKGIVVAVEHYRNNPELHDKIKKSGSEHVHRNYNHIKVANEALNSIINYSDNKSNFTSVRNKVISTVNNTFDKTNSVVTYLIKSNILFFRRFTLYRYPMHILIPTLLNKVITKIIKK